MCGQIFPEPTPRHCRPDYGLGGNPASGFWHRRRQRPRQSAIRVGFLAWGSVALIFLGFPSELLAQRPPAPRPPAAAARPGPGTVATSPGPVSPQAAARLSAPFRATLEGRRFRELLSQLAQLAEVNLWIDRQLDPDQLVSLNPAPRTLFGTIADLAESVGAEAVVIDRLVLVGPPAKVHALLGLLLSSPAPELLTTTAETIGWPVASTPAEAMQAITGDPDAGHDLPHDLWPAVRWDGISVPLATLLVTAQFDRMPTDWSSRELPSSTRLGRPPRASRSDSAASPAADRLGAKPAERSATNNPAPPDSNEPPARPTTAPIAPFTWSDRYAPLTPPSTLVVSHPSGPHAGSLRQAVTTADPQAWVKPVPASNRLEVGGSPAAHAAAIRQTLRHLAPQATKVDLDKVRFTLNLRGIPAGSVFAQLAMTADRRLAIDPSAQTACQTLVMLTAEDRTLRELTALVAEQIGVRAEWSAEELRISRP